MTTEEYMEIIETLAAHYREPLERDKQMIYRRFILGESYQKIADDMGYTAHSVSSHVWRKIQLAKEIKKNTAVGGNKLS